MSSANKDPAWARHSTAFSFNSFIILAGGRRELSGAERSTAQRQIGAETVGAKGLRSVGGGDDPACSVG